MKVRMRESPRKMLILPYITLPLMITKANAVNIAFNIYNPSVYHSDI